MAQHEIYRFGDMVLDVRERRLSLGARPLALAPKAHDVLVHLVRNGGRLVTRIELLDSVWSGSVVEDGIVSVQIAALRKTLGDDSDAPRFIETVARSGYRFIAPVVRAGDRDEGAAAAPPRSVAVLPFTDLSETKDQAWLGDGLAEEIIDTLARVPKLHVVARTSAFALRGRQLDVRTIADTLRVRAVLEGSVRRTGDRVRVVVRLIDARSGYQLWTERYDRAVVDVLTMQHDIAESVAGAFQLGPLAAPAAPVPHAPGFAAYEAYMRGKYFGLRFGSDSLARSRQSFERALELEPDYALAHAGLGLHYFALATMGSPAETTMPAARDAAKRALAIDPELVEAHVLLALVASTYDYDWPAAEREFNLAMADEPASPWASDMYGAFYLLQVDRVEDGGKAIRRALESDPLNGMYRVHHGAYLIAARREHEAVAEIEQAVDVDPDFMLARAWLALAYGLLGRWEDAHRHAERMYALAPLPQSAGILAATSQRLGQTARAEALLQHLRGGSEPGCLTGLVSFALGADDVEQTLEWAEKSLRHREMFAMLPALLRRVCASSPRSPR